MKTYILFFALLFSVKFMFSQGIYSNWYFGNHAALYFATNTNPPTILNNSAIYQAEGCSTISDAAGNLLFYTGGDTVWTQQHTIMANGTGLFGHKSSTQSALIIKQPGSANLYYIFTVMGASAYPQGLRYSIVDMSLAAGMGSVTIKNAPLYIFDSMEQLHATKHSNGLDYWIMTHEAGTNNFRAYLLSSAGVNTTAVVSSVGTTPYGTANVGGGLGCLKFSPTGQKLCVTALLHNLVELYDFNKSTGTVSNPFTLTAETIPPPSGYTKRTYACEFSPDETKLYCTAFFVGSNNSSDYSLTQWNLSAGSNSAILSSSVGIAAYGTNDILGMPQLAPNGKIYIAVMYQQNNTGSPAIGIINNPNAAGSNCNYVNSGQSVVSNVTSNLSFLGLPGMVYEQCSSNFVLSNSNIITCYNTANGSAAVINTTGYPSYIWSNGATSFTTQQVNSLSAGQWSVTVTGVLGCSTQSVFTVTQLPPSTSTPSIVSSNLNVCIGGTVTLTASGANSYTWSNGLQTPSIVVTPNINTTYYVTGTDANGCSVSSAPVTLNVVPLPTLNINASNSFTLCSPQMQTLTVSGAYSYLWQWGVNNFVTTNFIFINPAVTTQYSITGTDVNGCSSSKVVTVTIGCVGLDGFEIKNEGLNVFPNPVNEMLNIDISTSLNVTGTLNGQMEVRVIDVLGKEIINDELKENGGRAQIDVTELKSGIYFIRVGNATRKFAKE